MARIGIMGGTFNPIHLAHLSMAEQAYRQANLCKVLFMPSKNPPHKTDVKIASEKHRETMIRLAIEGISYFEFSDFEFKREGMTYSAQTLALLHKQFKEDEFFFIMGADSLFYIEEWYCPEELMKLATILPVGRSGSDELCMEKHASKLRNKYGAKIQIIKMNHMNISSSDIRRRIANGESVKNYLTDSVWRYIQKTGCYLDK